MKKLAKSLIILILIIAIIWGAIIGYFYRQAQAYIQSNTIDTTTAITRTMKASLRNSINNTTNASLVQILQYGYDTLHTFNIQRQEKSWISAWEHTIKTEEMIIDIAIQIPGTIAAQITTQNNTGNNGVSFQYNDQFLWSLSVYTLSWWTEQEEIELLNNEKIAEQSGYIIAYTQVLDNPFTGIELEAFGEIAAVFNTAVWSTQIINIQSIDKKLVYITSIQTGESLSITIDPIIVFTGEEAAKALAQYEPELCESILSWTDQTLCFPPNNTYILNETPDDSITLRPISEEWIQILINLIDPTVSTQATRAAPETLRENREKTYKQTVFQIYSIDNTIIQITEQYVPKES